MDIHNLSVVIGPNILHCRKQGCHDSKTKLTIEAGEMPAVVAVVKELIQRQEALFVVSH